MLFHVEMTYVLPIQLSGVPYNALLMVCLRLSLMLECWMHLMFSLVEEKVLLQRVHPSRPVWWIRCPCGSEQGRGGVDESASG